MRLLYGKHFIWLATPIGAKTLDDELAINPMSASR